MSSTSTQRPSYYARLICNHMKALPNHYAPSLEDVRDRLGLSEAAFKMGLDWCIARKIIVMDSAKAPMTTINTSVEEEAMKGESSRLSSMLRSHVLAEAS